MADDLRALLIRLAALEDAARTVPVVAPDDPNAVINPELQEVIDQEKFVVEQIRHLRAAMVQTEQV